MSLFDLFHKPEPPQPPHEDFREDWRVGRHWPDIIVVQSGGWST